MNRFLPYLTLAFLVSCATAGESGQDSLDYIAKQKIASENTSPDSYAMRNMCPPAPVAGDDGAVMRYVATRTPYATAVASDFTLHWNGKRDKVSLDNALEKYVSEVSYADQPSSFGSLNCWTGNLYQGALIGDLKDNSVTWISLVIENGNPVGARKCAYADDPDMWTVQTCPSQKRIAP